MIGFLDVDPLPMSNYDELRRAARNASLSTLDAEARHWQGMAAQTAARARAAVGVCSDAETTELQTWAAIFAEYARLCADTDEDRYLNRGCILLRPSFRDGLLRISMPIWTAPVVAHSLYPEPVRPVVDAHGRVVEVPVAGLFQGFPGTAFADEGA